MIVDELKAFRTELKSYKRFLDKGEQLSENQKGYKESLREKLVRKVGALKAIVTELTHKPYVTQMGHSYEIWHTALSTISSPSSRDDTLTFCIDAVNEAIGKLEAGIKKGRTDKAEDAIEKPIKKPSLGKEVRKHLQGTPEEIGPHIVRVAQEFQFQGFKYLAQEVSYKSSQFSKEFTILCGEYVGPQISTIGDVEDEEHPKNRHIGTIILQSLTNNKTLFISKKKSDDLVDADSYFSSYLNNTLKELRELGFVESWPNKAWRVLKELVGVYKAVKP